MGFGSRSPGCKFWWFVLNFLCSFYFLCSAAKNNITQGQRITGKETLISSGQRFELGFFSPGNSTRRYLGIWYYKVSMQSVVWIANRQNPIIGEGGAFAFGENGELMVLDGNGQSVWSSHTSVTSGNATAILMDTGNFIIWNGDQNVDVNVALWQSFNHPTDTFLPEMKVKIPAAETPVFTAWRSADDPSPGQYSMGIDPRGPPQIVIWDGSRRRWRSGQFDGIIFTGVPNMPAIFSSGFRLLSEEDGDMYFIYHSSNISALLRFRIGWDGNEELQKWDEGRGVWNITQWQPANGCELYNKCGAFAICSVKDSRLCTCIEGFVPKNEDQWKGRNWTEGCVRRTELECQWNSSGIGADDGGGDGFRRIQGVKLPDFADFMTAANFDECRDKCLKNCSCLAYAFDRGINCLIWGGDLVDIQLFAQGGNDLYIRLAGSELGQENKISKLVIVVIVVIGAFCIVVSIWLLWRFRMKKKVAEIPNSQWKNNQLPAIDARSGEYLKDFSVAEELGVEGKQRTGPELFLFSFSDVAAATNNFSDIKKLGKGGFGPVFKGMLPGGEEIAVKRLSRMSGQGLEEFKNEIMLIAKLQHINLVRLLGCCIEGDERMLIYEYMPNNSLDSFLFDPFKRAQLDWEKRISIIEGIARGLLYLHRDSRLRIIHRDLKASNVLLDEDLNPKISDFGLAKIFRRNESEASTSRVVGTYGYMAPEYAMEGLFSVKSDVYSFGILLLEIVSGRRNSSFRSPEHSTMIGYVWDLWDGGKAIELVDPSIADSCCQSMALRCIHIAMLCVQDQAASRPTMAAILMMLESENSTLPMPRQPTFTSMRRSVDLDIWKDSHEIASSNDVSVSLIMGR